jgi:PAS domain S-box-containing protein
MSVDQRRVQLAGAELEFLREAVMAALLAPAADIAASSPADSEAAADVRRAAGLLSRIGWPGDPPGPVEIAHEDLPEARRALLALIAGATEGVWEAVTAALDAGGYGSDGVHEALSEFGGAGHVLRLLDGVAPAPDWFGGLSPLASVEARGGLRALVDLGQMMLWTTTAAGELDFASDAMCRFLGQEAPELLGGGWLETVDPAERERVHRGFLAALQEQRPFELEFRVMRASRDPARVVARAAPRIEGDVFRGYLASLEDVTVKREIRAALKGQSPAPEFRWLGEVFPD